MTHVSLWHELNVPMALLGAHCHIWLPLSLLDQGCYTLLYRGESAYCGIHAQSMQVLLGLAQKPSVTVCRCWKPVLDQYIAYVLRQYIAPNI
jgi:hypothetical protein